MTYRTTSAYEDETPLYSSSTEHGGEEYQAYPRYYPETSNPDTQPWTQAHPSYLYAQHGAFPTPTITGNQYEYGHPQTGYENDSWYQFPDASFSAGQTWENPPNTRVNTGGHLGQYGYNQGGFASQNPFATSSYGSASTGQTFAPQPYHLNHQPVNYPPTDITNNPNPARLIIDNQPTHRRDRALLEAAIAKERSKYEKRRPGYDSRVHFAPLVWHDGVNKLSQDRRGISLPLLYFTLASPESIVSFQEALESYRGGIIGRFYERGVGFEPIARIHIIQSLNENKPLFNIIRRYHIVKLNDFLTNDNFNISTAAQFQGNQVALPGNPINKAKKVERRRKVRQLYPSIPESDPGFEQKLKFMNFLRRLAIRLNMLKNLFGMGVLALIPAIGSSPSEGLELGITDDQIERFKEETFRKFVTFVQQSQGQVITNLCRHMEPLVEKLVSGTLSPNEVLPLENYNSDLILENLPKGSSRFLELLQLTFYS